MKEQAPIPRPMGPLQEGDQQLVDLVQSMQPVHDSVDPIDFDRQVPDHQYLQTHLSVEKHRDSSTAFAVQGNPLAPIEADRGQTAQVDITEGSISGNHWDRTGGMTRVEGNNVQMDNGEWAHDPVAADEVKKGIAKRLAKAHRKIGEKALVGAGKAEF